MGALGTRVRLLAAAIVVVALSGVASAVVVSTAAANASTGTPGHGCNAGAVPVALPVGLALGGDCTGVRPGAPVLSDVGQCTLNFMWKGSDGRTYMGTAGHCAVESNQAFEKTWKAGTGPVATDANGDRIGEFAYAVLSETKDFSLIRLDDGVAADPQLCHFGGPTGINNDQPGSVVTLLQEYGQGLGLSALTPARTLLALGMPDPDVVFATGLVLPGDSGSGVTTPDGRAVGVVVTLDLLPVTLGSHGLEVGNVGITRLGPQIARAQRVTGVTYTLQTAPIV